MNESWLVFVRTMANRSTNERKKSLSKFIATNHKSYYIWIFLNLRIRIEAERDKASEKKTVISIVNQLYIEHEHTYNKQQPK